MGKLLKLFLPLVFLLLFSFSSSEGEKNSQQQGTQHQTFGLYQNGGFGVSGGVVKYDSYQTRVQHQTGYRFRYEIYLVSRTQMWGSNQYRNINAYGIQVFVNNQNVTISQYPYGLNATITVNGTIVYAWETNDPMPTFNVTWQNLQ